MGLIINTKIRQVIKGYPTVAQRAETQPAVLEGTENVHFGDVVVRGSETGRYVKGSTTTAVTAANFAGIVMATNIKVPKTVPATTATVETAPGEAFELFFKGAIAIELVEGTALTDIKEGAPVYVTADGLFTLDDADDVIQDTAVFNAVASGIYEGGNGAPIIAEIWVK